MNEKKYYWLKLEENYFDLKIQKALRKLPSGAEMLICYLKMQLKYLNTGGLIEFNNICSSLSEEIALDIDEEEDLVKMTIAVLTKWNVIEVEDSNLYITEMQNRIGSKTDAAIRMEKHRKQQKQLENCNNVTSCYKNVQKCNSIKEIEKEIDIEIEKEKEENKKEEKNLFEFIEENFGRTLSPIEYEIIREWEDTELTRYAIKEAVLNSAYSIKYIQTILNNWKHKNIRTVQEAQKDQKKFKNKNIEPIPEWFDKYLQNEEMTKEEEKEFKDLINSF